MQRAEDPQKHLLRQVEGLFAVAQEMGRKPKHQSVVLEHEGRVREVVSGNAPLDECSFAAGDFRRPSNGFCRFG